MTDARPEVLFLAHRIPWPPDRGDRIRSWHVLSALARHATVHCGCLIESAVEPAQAQAIGAVTASRCFAPRKVSLGWAGIAALVGGHPVSVAAFASARLARWVDRLLTERPIGAIYVFSGQMAQFVPDRWRGRVVMDFVDVDSAKFAAFAKAAQSWPVRAIHAREARVLSAFEQRAAHRADLSVLVTPAERDLFLAQMIDPAGVAVAALGNGIDARYFSPDAVAPDQSMVGAGAQIVFTGQMDYAPNVAAVCAFARTVMPIVLAARPDARFVIVGRAPSAAVRALDGQCGTRVTGEVADVRPWLAAAAVVAAPLEIARGIQNKVLEAMAMARAVVLTSAAATGISGKDGVHFAIADGAAAQANRVLALIDDRAGAQAMGAAARALVLEQAGWDKALAPLPAMMGWTDAA